MGKIRMELTGDEAKVVDSLRKSQAEVDKLNDKIKDLNAEAKRGGDNLESAFAKGAKGAFGAVAAVTGVGSALAAFTLVISTLKSELDDIERKQRNAASTQITLANAQQQARQAAIGSGVSGDQVAAIVERVARQTQKTQREVYQGATQVLSAGGVTGPELESSLKLGIRAGSATGEKLKMGDIGLGSLQLSRAMGGTQEGALSFAGQLGAMTGRTDWGSLAQEAAPVLQTMKAGGGTPDDMLKLFGYLRTQTKKQIGGGDMTMMLRAIDAAGGVPQMLEGGWGSKGEDVQMRDPVMKAALESLINKEPSAMAAWNAQKPGAFAGDIESFLGAGGGRGVALREFGEAGGATIERLQQANKGAPGRYIADMLQKVMTEDPALTKTGTKVRGMLMSMQGAAGTDMMGTLGEARQQLVDMAAISGGAWRGVSGTDRRYGELPANAKRIMGVPTTGGGRVWEPNPDYNPASAQALKDLVQALDATTRELVGNTKATKEDAAAVQGMATPPPPGS